MYLDEAESSVPGKMRSVGTNENLEDTFKGLGFRYLLLKKQKRLRWPSWRTLVLVALQL